MMPLIYCANSSHKFKMFPFTSSPNRNWIWMIVCADNSPQNCATIARHIGLSSYSSHTQPVCASIRRRSPGLWVLVWICLFEGARKMPRTKRRSFMLYGIWKIFESCLSFQRINVSGGPGTALNGESGRLGWISCIERSKARKILGYTLEHATFSARGVSGATQTEQQRKKTVNRNLLFPRSQSIISASWKAFLKKLRREMDVREKVAVNVWDGNLWIVPGEIFAFKAWVQRAKLTRCVLRPQARFSFANRYRRTDDT